MAGPSLIRVRFFSSRRMATVTTAMTPVITPAANRPMAASAIKAMTDLFYLDRCWQPWHGKGRSIAGRRLLMERVVRR
jgi:hypothetical protein